MNSGTALQIRCRTRVPERGEKLFCVFILFFRQYTYTIRFNDIHRAFVIPGGSNFRASCESAALFMRNERFKQRERSVI